jgi:predicted AAA+ superfamily ATPase
MNRPEFIQKIRRAFEVTPTVALLGPRQCGKTTLARAYIAEWVPDLPAINYFDLEDPTDLNRLSDAKLALADLQGLIVIDEIQRRPELFPLLRTLIDRTDHPARFLILGSASRDLIRQGSETLAGRISFVEVTPFAGHEVGGNALDMLWIRGGFPLSFLASSIDTSAAWRKTFIRTFLERDIPALGITIPPQTIRRFWQMLVHYHGQTFNASEIGSSMGVSDTTASRYLDILSGTFMVRRLQPWFENIGKRQVKRPKIYFRDSGIFHSLLGSTTREELLVHPKLGTSWEGFALEEMIRLNGADEDEVYFWAVHQQAELDLLIVRGSQKLGFEFKYGSAPGMTRSLGRALELLALDSITVVYPGDKDYALADNIRVRGLKGYLPDN